MQGPTYAAARPDAILLDFEGERTDIAAYEAAGGYKTALAQAARPFDEFVQELKDSGLRGRGGAGFPTGMKGSSSARATRYLVVNADESEPGTFKDRELMLRNPHALIEGSLMRCYAIDSQRGLHLHPRRVRDRGRSASTRRSRRPYARGYVGTTLPGARVRVDIHLHRGAGAYICGEETALLTALKASAASRPRSRRSPPWPGLDEPDAPQQRRDAVMTVPYIFAMGADRYQPMRHRADDRAPA